MVICKLCNRKAEIEKGWFNIAAFMYPLCVDHMKEYKEFKKQCLEDG